jgi:hypothetical protein
MGILDYLDHFRPHTTNIRTDEIMRDIVHDLMNVDRRYSKDRKKDDIHSLIEDLERQHKLIEHLDFWMKVRLVKIQDGIKRTQQEINREKQKEERQKRKDHKEKEKLLKLKAQLRYNEIAKSDSDQKKEMDRLRAQVEEGMKMLAEDRRHIESIKKKLNQDNREINLFRRKMRKARHKDIRDLQHIKKNC